MNWRFLLIMSLLGSIFAPYLIFSFEDSSAQLIKKPQPNIGTKSNEGFRLGITFFGVKKDTGNVFWFMKVNNVTTGKYSNVSKEDAKDHDGVVDSVISLPNTTIPTGANFTACYVILKNTFMSCKSGINIQGRLGVIQFVLDSFKEIK